MDRENLHTLIFEHSSRAAAVIDQAGYVLQSNQSFRRSTDIEANRLPEPVLNSLRAGTAFHTADSEGHARVLITYPRDGRDQPATLSKLPGKKESLYLLEYHGHHEENHLEIALKESEQRFFKLQQNLPVGIYRANETGDIAAANPALVKMMGFRSFNELQAAELKEVWFDLKERETLIDRLRNEGSVLDYMVHLKRKGGEDIIASFDAHGTFSEQGDLLYFDTIVQDITEKVKALRELELQATTDSLTGLFNRQHLMKKLAEELRRASRYSEPITMILMDLDFFKRINDTMGHLTGDMLLKDVARLVFHSLRETDFAGRYGGEEFCIVLPETKLNGGISIAKRLRKILEKQTFSTPEGDPVRITCSIGVAEASEYSVSALLAKADFFLYEAKRAGRNRVEPELMPE